jgi:selenocysteine-specific elongation factor
MKRIIVGTAGHIDHGKTALVKALTGVNADRLKEEQERGITIDIGFADLTVGDTHFGFVDVPGHERFVKNMLAGAHGLDLVMLVVAADESLMPQTREHFDICRLLALKAGLIVITKCDLVEADFAELVETEVSEYVAGSFLENAPILRVSSRTGEGLEALKQALGKLAHQVAARDVNAVARLPIDRVFTIKGFGTVVTGTLIAGQINTGDELEVLPSDELISKTRGLQVHGKMTQTARAGERTAVNLQGIELGAVTRGQTLAPAHRLQTSQLLDVSIQLLKTAPRPLKTRSRVHLHIGTAEVLARVVLLGQNELAPGTTGLAQLRLESSTLALPNDRFILRSYSPTITIGGGFIVDPLPAKHRARDRARVIAHLHQLVAADELERLALFVEMAEEKGCSFAELAARSGAADATLHAATDKFTKAKRLVTVSQNPLRLIAQAPFTELGKRLRAALKAYHQQAPLESGMARETLREKLFAHTHTDTFRAVIATLAERNEIVADKDLLRLATHRVALSDEEQTAKDHVAQAYAQAGLQPLALEEVLQQVKGVDAQRAQRFAQMLLNSGELVRVGELVFHRSSLDGLRATLQAYKAQNGSQLDVAAFKDLTGVSRKYAIPLLEYCDRQRITRRAGEAREIL